MITKFGVALGGLLPAVQETVSEWEPPADLRRETQYRDDLRRFLSSRIPPDASLRREYPHKGGRWDLRLGWKGLVQRDEVFIELKLNLHKKTELDRLVGQMDALDPTEHALLLVLVGETAPHCLERLEKFLPEPLLMPYPQAKLAIVQRPIGR